ncbi:NAD(P)-binding protein [Xylariomycetidae sp. FL2044]|nr:NAD(P)-binding protein [Xylariomycetidae sp. FL2044]
MHFNLLGKHCVITGGSRGIGLAIAQHFARESATCTLVGRNRESLDRAVRSLGEPSGQDRHHHHRQKHRALDFDVSERAGWGKLKEDLRERKIDVLVNAAGITQNSLFVRTNPEAIDDIIATNLMGTILGCRTVIPNMIINKGGCIINVASLLATHGGRGASVYAASKAGIVGLTRSLASEVGRSGIRVNVLLPGYIHTDMTKSMDEYGALSCQIPMGRLGSVEEVAHAAAFLAQNTYAHNCVLNLDGGLSAT